MLNANVLTKFQYLIAKIIFNICLKLLKKFASFKKTISFAQNPFFEKKNPSNRTQWNLILIKFVWSAEFMVKSIECITKRTKITEEGKFNFPLAIAIAKICEAYKCVSR